MAVEFRYLLCESLSLCLSKHTHKLTLTGSLPGTKGPNSATQPWLASFLHFLLPGPQRWSGHSRSPWSLPGIDTGLYLASLFCLHLERFGEISKHNQRQPHCRADCTDLEGMAESAGCIRHLGRGILCSVPSCPCFLIRRKHSSYCRARCQAVGFLFALSQPIQSHVQYLWEAFRVCRKKIDIDDKFSLAQKCIICSKNVQTPCCMSLRILRVKLVLFALKSLICCLS